MKTLLKSVCFVLTMTLLCTSCKNDDNDPMDDPNTDPPTMGEQNIVEVATDTPELSSLVAALQRANLVSALEADGNFTVLAPTNTAFDTFLAGNGFSALDEVPVDVLEQLLLNHVIPGTDAALRASDLMSAGMGYAETLAASPEEGVNINTFFNATNGVRFNDVSSVSTPDVNASNGIVHIVDAVIPLPTVVTFVAADPNFSTLEDVLVNQLLDAGWTELLNTPFPGLAAPFTLFAPDESAFGKLDALPDPVALDKIIAAHIVTGGNIRSNAILDGGSTPATRAGDNLQFSVANDGIITILDGLNQTITVIMPVDLQAANGVIHTVDTVILPSNLND